MRINSAAVQAQMPVQNAEAIRQQYQVRVLKKALESQKAAGEQLLDLIEPKGRVLDIKA